MKKYFFLCALLCVMMLHAESSIPYYVPGDGVYVVGLDSALQPVLSEPTMVAGAYQASLRVFNTKAATLAAKVLDDKGEKEVEKDFQMVSYLQGDTLLNLERFLGVGYVYNLTVRDLDIAHKGNPYQMGDNAPSKTWSKTYLLAAYNSWKKHATFPLGMYDHWDCPVTTDSDPILKEGADAVTVDFGNPGEGLVIDAITFTLVSTAPVTSLSSLAVKLSVEGAKEQTVSLQESMFTKVEGKDWYSVVVPVKKTVIASRFAVTVSGFSQCDAWLPRAVDTHAMYPTHTLYSNGKMNLASDVCLHVRGYFNYLGNWGRADGKVERGECVASADYIQIYYDPEDEDWPGDFFMGEAAFPVECTFGASDIDIASQPDWLISFEMDQSQWTKYGAVQLIMVADDLPDGVTGRTGKIVFTTLDGASQYTILVRQGTAWFDELESIDYVVDLPAMGGTYDLLGRPVKEMQHGTVYIQNGKKIMY